MITGNMKTQLASHASPIDDVHTFWSERWSGQKLGWHLDEVNPILQTHFNSLTESFESDSGNGTNRGARIFVPLCGKSVDLAFLATQPKISHVVGIDIVQQAAEDFSKDHPHFSLEEYPAGTSVDVTKAECNSEESGGDSCTNTIAATTSSVFHGKGISIVIDDLFDFLGMDDIGRSTIINKHRSAATTDKHSGNEPYLFDAIYDRASMVAIKPTLREDYATRIGDLLRPGGTILLITLERRKVVNEEDKNKGPPFSISENQVRQHYEMQPWVESVILLEDQDEFKTDADRERWLKSGVLEMRELVFLIRKKL